MDEPAADEAEEGEEADRGRHRTGRTGAEADAREHAVEEAEPRDADDGG